MAYKKCVTAAWPHTVQNEPLNTKSPTTFSGGRMCPCRPPIAQWALAYHNQCACYGSLLGSTLSHIPDLRAQ